MKSFLKQIEESFESLDENEKRWQDSDGDGKWYEPGEDVKAEAVDQNLDGENDWDDIRMAKMIASGEYVKCDKCKGKGCDHCDNMGLHKTTNEMSVTGGLDGGAGPPRTPRAFSKKTRDLNQSTGYRTVSNKKMHTEYDQVQEAMDRKYERLIEGYRAFALSDSKITPEQKVKRSISEVAKQLRSIEETIRFTSRLKNESGISHSGFGNSTKNALTKISERLIKISERVRSLGE